MQMQGKPVSEMHNTFWRMEQVLVTFHSATPLISSDGRNQGLSILEKLNLPFQLQQLNTFLAENGVNYTLNFYQPIDEDDDSPQARPTRGPGRKHNHGQFSHLWRFHSTGEGHAPHPGAAHRSQDTFTPPPGVYLFGLNEPIQSDFGVVATSIATFFDFTPNESDQPVTGAGDDGTDEEPPENQSPVVLIVNTLNEGLETLNGQQVPVSAVSPNLLCGGTTYVPQGCPLAPPIPVDDGCSFWHFELPLLSPADLRSMTGEGVTVFVLDTLPDLEVIKSATTRAGDDNLLLFDVSRNVTFNYDIWNYWATHTGDPRIPPLAVGKDVYGRHYAFKMLDHGLFIAGIVHDIAPHARVECIRVMNDYCVSDSNLFLNALYYIQNRMSPGGDLYQRPVVINLSCVIPTIVELDSAGINLNAGVPFNVLTQINQALLALAQLGAIIPASSGNEADLRENPGGMRPPALYPAAFGDPAPINPGFPPIHGVIPVGAVDKDSNATSYSCYPGSNGIATYGGEVPLVDPADPPSNDPDVTVNDTVRGIYSAARYPALSKDSPAHPYKAPNNHAWASWVGTSFATPIVSAVAARVLDLHRRGGTGGDLPSVIMNSGGGTQTLWNDLDPVATGVSGGSTTGLMLLAIQECQVLEEEDDE